MYPVLLENGEKLWLDDFNDAACMVYEIYDKKNVG